MTYERTHIIVCGLYLHRANVSRTISETDWLWLQVVMHVIAVVI